MATSKEDISPLSPGRRTEASPRERTDGSSPFSEGVGHADHHLRDADERYAEDLRRQRASARSAARGRRGLGGTPLRDPQRDLQAAGAPVLEQAQGPYWRP